MKRQRSWNIFLYLIVLIVACSPYRQLHASEESAADKAFRIYASLLDAESIRIQWDVAPGCRLYQKQMRFVVEEGAATLGSPSYSRGVELPDPLTGKKSLVYRNTATVDVPLVSHSGPFLLKVRYQGCTESGLCYPPEQRFFTVDAQQPGLLAETTKMEFATYLGSYESNGEALDKLPAQGGTPGVMPGDKALWKTVLAFLFFGLLLSCTPCILPMVPILSSIIIGQGTVSRLRGFLLALAYSLGMALVYTALGIAAGLAGEGLAGFLQQPVVLIGFSILLVLLALSMFDVYQLQVPASIQTKLNNASGKNGSQRFIGTFIMGALSALVIGPCVAAPLGGTLIYISQTKDVVTGGVSLFSMAVGMSMPLLLIGVSAGHFLPRAGAWMVSVKYIFGLLLLATAIWMASPVLPPQAVLFATGTLLMLSAVFLGVFDSLTQQASVGERFRKTFGAVALIVGLLQFVGAASGGSTVLEPLSGITGNAQVLSDQKQGKEQLNFITIHSSSELDRILHSVQGPVMLDFYADWCISCKELEHITFRDPGVIKALEQLTIVQADVTANTAEERALMKRFSLFGPPALLFFDSSGKEMHASRIIGFIKAKDFLAHLGTYIPETHSFRSSLGVTEQ